MMVLPENLLQLNDDVDVVDESELPTLTYGINFKKGVIRGKVDKLQAMEQAIYKIINTDRFQFLIYSDDYGFENIIGNDNVFIRAELPRRIEEALLQDERITAVENITIEQNGDSATVSFAAITIYGDVDVLKEVINFA